MQKQKMRAALPFEVKELTEGSPIEIDVSPRTKSAAKALRKRGFIGLNFDILPDGFKLDQHDLRIPLIPASRSVKAIRKEERSGLDLLICDPLVQYDLTVARKQGLELVGLIVFISPELWVTIEPLAAR